MDEVCHILLVEDNPADQRLALEAFKETRTACRIHVVSDGEQAIEFLRHQGEYLNEPSPKLIILDLNLPKKDGRDVLAEIKLDPELKKIPVVVLTTSDAEEDIDRSYELQASCYVTKPSDLDDVFFVIKGITDYWFGIAKLPASHPHHPGPELRTG